jgi:hypothetical protein
MARLSLIDELKGFVRLVFGAHTEDWFNSGGGGSGRVDGDGGGSSGSGGGSGGMECEVRGGELASWSLNVSRGHASDLHGPGNSSPWRSGE